MSERAPLPSSIIQPYSGEGSPVPTPHEAPKPKDYSIHRRYEKTEKGKAAKARYKQSPKGRAKDYRYNQSEKGIAAHKRYTQSEKGRQANREGHKRRYHTRKQQQAPQNSPG